MTTLNLYSIAMCTIYTNLGDDGIIHGISQTNVSTVITSVELLPKLIAVKDKVREKNHKMPTVLESKRIISFQLPHMKQIIYFESALKPKPDDVDGLELHSYTSVLDKGLVSCS